MLCCPPLALWTHVTVPYSIGYNATMASTTKEDATPTRRPYRGSCHCGHIKYIVFLTLPPASLNADDKSTDTTRMYKCNCGVCMKFGYFHTRVTDAPNDFYLLHPINPTAGVDAGGLKDYRCVRGVAGWYFCQFCGVRCFCICGKSETKEVDLELLTEGKSEGKLTKVFKMVAEGWDEDDGCYFSANAHTLERDQGLDLREWHEKGWIRYYDNSVTGDVKIRFGRPYEGGEY